MFRGPHCLFLSARTLLTAGMSYGGKSLLECTPVEDEHIALLQGSDADVTAETSSEYLFVAGVCVAIRCEDDLVASTAIRVQRLEHTKLQELSLIHI
eukprot:4190194-Amphidinium_carterae.1